MSIPLSPPRLNFTGRVEPALATLPVAMSGGYGPS
jgi:hypothetical protein